MTVDLIQSDKLIDFAERTLVMLDESISVSEAAKEMRKKGVMSVLVSREHNCVGIVTEKDILYRVVAENRGPFKTPLKNVMSSPLITMDAQAPVRDAISLMRAKYIRRLPITEAGKVVGLLTLKSIVGNSLDQSVALAELELPQTSGSFGTACPYCESKFASKEDMSKHIDRLHLGSGLLEGDLRKW
jgi:signal-transduction protein with cAMP-binding, CBS, and nucleotidyltransferase domain